MVDKEKNTDIPADARRPKPERSGSTADEKDQAGKEEGLSKRGTAKGDRKEDALADDKTNNSE